MSVSALSGCQQGGPFGFLTSPPDAEGGSTPATATRLVERDVEAPEVFQVTETALWDGRPSLGGVWVAYPDVTDPERVIIRNSANGKFVIGALFRRDRPATGAALQVSSDAAEALGMVSGQPAELNVTALRRDETAVPVTEEAETTPPPDGEIDSEPLAAAAAAIASAEAVEPDPAPTPAPRQPQASALAKPYIQVGIFSVQANATRTGETLRQAGVVPTVYDQESRGKRFWRVVVGPAGTATERAQLLEKVKGLGYSDAYFVTN
ncbi:SPOR domain-containing protein [Rhodovulum adriaticum]|uniref:SPOR domain-containing protein n=1 Tax=Rhodovulum adriaticum TaxID=35804 RepID=UPI0010466077|nr:SPOR domain-containing protein [Rhodovulum adriaticum]